ncbi:MAG: hypothetical protein H0W23_09275 [Chloroflexia bacterium]|nr:hypothetical protein [Chloroflexia bacterium]
MTADRGTRDNRQQAIGVNRSPARLTNDAGRAVFVVATEPFTFANPFQACASPGAPGARETVAGASPKWATSPGEPLLALSPPSSHGHLATPVASRPYGSGEPYGRLPADR